MAKALTQKHKLPQGWEKRVDTNSGTPYFVDHVTRTSHWEIPPPPPPPPHPFTTVSVRAPQGSVSKDDMYTTIHTTHTPLITRHSRSSTIGSSADAGYASSDKLHSVHEENKNDNTLDNEEYAPPDVDGYIQSLESDDVLTYRPRTDNISLHQIQSRVQQPRAPQTKSTRTRYRQHSNTVDTPPMSLSITLSKRSRTAAPPKPATTTIQHSSSARNIRAPPKYSKQSGSALPPPPPRKQTPQPPQPPQPPVRDSHHSIDYSMLSVSSSAPVASISSTCADSPTHSFTPYSHSVKSLDTSLSTTTTTTATSMSARGLFLSEDDSIITKSLSLTTSVSSSSKSSFGRRAHARTAVGNQLSWRIQKNFGSIDLVNRPRTPTSAETSAKRHEKLERFKGRYKHKLKQMRRKIKKWQSHTNGDDDDGEMEESPDTYADDDDDEEEEEEYDEDGGDEDDEDECVPMLPGKRKSVLLDIDSLASNLAAVIEEDLDEEDDEERNFRTTDYETDSDCDSNDSVVVKKEIHTNVTVDELQQKFDTV